MQNHRQRVSTSPSQETVSSLEGGTIGELARRTGLTTKAIRYYESIGVLPPSSRGANGYRCYSQADVNRLNLLRRLRLLGISLAEARSLLTATLEVVLQKRERKEIEREQPLQFFLSNQSKQFGDQRDLPFDISFCHSPHLSFPNHVHDLIPL